MSLRSAEYYYLLEIKPCSDLYEDAGAFCPTALIRGTRTLLPSSAAHDCVLCLCPCCQDLLKHTPVSHPDHPLLQDALRISQNFLSSINEEITPRRQSMTVKKGEVSLPALVIFSVSKY